MSDPREIVQRLTAAGRPAPTHAYLRMQPGWPANDREGCRFGTVKRAYTRDQGRYVPIGSYCTGCGQFWQAPAEG